MNLLLHVCCAPCATYSVGHFERLNHKVTGFFYNPNVHPFMEFQNRLQSLKEYAPAVTLPMIYDEEYDLQKFFDALGHQSQGRCPHCYQLRLMRTAVVAQEQGFDAFSTTLLISPYQQHDRIREIGERIAAEVGLQFVYEDLRPGFKQHYDLTRQYNLYRQKYCGCVFSEYDRYQPRKSSNNE